MNKSKINSEQQQYWTLVVDESVATNDSAYLIDRVVSAPNAEEALVQAVDEAEAEAKRNEWEGDFQPVKAYTRDQILRELDDCNSQQAAESGA